MDVDDPTVPGDLVAYGWSDRVAALAAEATAHLVAPFPGGPAPVPGRAIRADYDRVVVATAHGEVAASADELPAVGDWVVLQQPHPDAPLHVVAVLPRWSRLARHTAGKAAALQVMAANVDVVLVTAGLDRPLKATRFDRELVLAWDSGARPVVVLNKADVHPDPDEAKAWAEQRFPGVDVVVTSTIDGRGIDELRSHIGPTDTVVMLGSSGVGKSSLANQMLGVDLLDTGGVRVNDSKGRHTTTARHLVPLPGGGVLIDTPGLRAVGLFDASEGLELAFADIEELAAGCRFSDCSHLSEPDCAVRAALDDGTLPSARYESWVDLQAEVAAVERRTDVQARSEHKQRMKAQSKAIRRYYKEKEDER